VLGFVLNLTLGKDKYPNPFEKIGVLNKKFYFKKKKMNDTAVIMSLKHKICNFSFREIKVIFKLIHEFLLKYPFFYVWFGCV